MISKDKKFNLNHQYQLYLERVGLKESNMSPVQAKETKQAFFGAMGQMLVLQRDELAALSDDDAVDTLQDMWEQVAKYFNTLTRTMN